MNNDVCIAGEIPKQHVSVRDIADFLSIFIVYMKNYLSATLKTAKNSFVFVRQKFCDNFKKWCWFFSFKTSEILKHRNTHVVWEFERWFLKIERKCAIGLSQKFASFHFCCKLKHILSTRFSYFSLVCFLLYAQLIPLIRTQHLFVFE